MVTAQAQSSPFLAAGLSLPSQEQQRHGHILRPRPELQTLAVARDSHARSSFLGLRGPRPLGSKVAPSPKPTSSSAAGLLLESRTSRLARMPSASASCESSTAATDQLLWDEKREDKIPHLQACLQMTPSKNGSLTGDVLTVGAIPTRGVSCRLADLACGSIVACAGSPTAVRAVSREFLEACIASKYLEAEAMVQAVEDRKAHRALVEVESSMQGTNHRTYDLLLRHNVRVVGELVESCWGADDHEETVNRKRFWVLSRDVCTLPREEASFKTTVALVLREGLGTLHRALAAFAIRDIVITKLESRPWRAEPLSSAEEGPHCKTYFQYVLFIEFQSSIASRAAQNALAQLQELSSFLRLLGTYPSFHATTTALASTSLNQSQIAPSVLVTS